MCTVQGRRGIDSHRADLRHVEHREHPALTPKGESRGWENGRTTQRSFLARLGRAVTGWYASSRARLAVGWGKGDARPLDRAGGDRPIAFDFALTRRHARETSWCPCGGGDLFHCQSTVSSSSRCEEGHGRASLARGGLSLRRA
jgi:hypothetical protein